MKPIKLIGVSDYTEQGGGGALALVPQDASVVRAEYCYVRSELNSTCILGRLEATVDGNGNATGTTGSIKGEIYLGPGETLILHKERGEIWEVLSYESNTGTNRIYFCPVAPIG